MFACLQRVSDAPSSAVGRRCSDEVHGRVCIVVCFSLLLTMLPRELLFWRGCSTGRPLPNLHFVAIRIHYSSIVGNIAKSNFRACTSLPRYDKKGGNARREHSRFCCIILPNRNWYKVITTTRFSRNTDGLACFSWLLLELVAPSFGSKCTTVS